MKKNKKGKWVVLEHLTMPDRGRRFITMNSENNTHGITGKRWYKEILFTDSLETAQQHCSPNLKKLPTMEELRKHYKKNYST